MAQSFFKPLFMSRENNSGLRVRSVAFSHGGHIPPKYTCDGENVNPPLDVSDLPENTKSFALVVEYRDAPRGVYDQWVVCNISSSEAIAVYSRQGSGGCI